MRADRRDDRDDAGGGRPSHQDPPGALALGLARGLAVCQRGRVLVRQPNPLRRRSCPFRFPPEIRFFSEPEEPAGIG